jgi:type IV pilus assembly protein PilF
MRRIAALAFAALLLGAAGCATTPPSGNARGGQTPAEINVQLGVGYMQQGRTDLALEKLTRALELDPSSAQGHSVIAVLYERIGQQELAGTHYRRAIALAPQDPGIQNNYGRFLCTQNRLEEAERYFLSAVKDPHYRSPEVAYTNAGICAKRVPDLAKAEQYLRSALQVDPHYPPALVEMAEISYEQGNFLPARAYLQRYLDAAPNSAESLWLGIRIERKLGDRNAVASYSLLLKTHFPDSEETRWLLESE